MIAVWLDEVQAFRVIVRRQHQQAQLAGDVDQAMAVRVLGINGRGDGDRFLFELGVHHLHFDGFHVSRADDRDRVVSRFSCSLS
ncbi:hypothetical protein D3C84_1237000 [compost metagenome]